MKRSDIRPGMKFGRWTVTGAAFFPPGSKSYVVPVRCSCGNTGKVQPAQLGRTSNSCGCLRREWARKRMWKGGRTVLHGGYIGIWQPDHPNAEKIGYVREHILVMSRLLGRALLPHEEVHHKNGVKDDNSPGNLELWTTSQPKGQRVEDKIAWAKEFLAQYEPKALVRETEWDESE